MHLARQRSVRDVHPSPLRGGWPAEGRSGGRRGRLANDTARALRKRLTPQEVRVWIKLRELKSFGFHFRRQTPIGPYIVDFASFSDRVVIEIDGGQHAMPESIRSDEERDEFLLSRGFRVLRYWNSEVDQNLTGVVEDILSHLNTPTPTG